MTKKERRLGFRRKEYDTQADLVRDYKRFKDQWQKGMRQGMTDMERLTETPVHQQMYIELQSLATPVIAIEMLRRIRPDMVQDTDGADWLTFADDEDIPQ